MKGSKKKVKKKGSKKKRKKKVGVSRGSNGSRGGSNGSRGGKKGGGRSTPMDIVSGVIVGLLKVADKGELDVILKLNSKLLGEKLTGTDCSVLTNVKNYFIRGRGKGIAQDIINRNKVIKEWVKESMEKDSKLHLLFSKLDKCGTGSVSRVKTGGSNGQLPDSFTTIMGTLMGAVVDGEGAVHPMIMMLIALVSVQMIVCGVVLGDWCAGRYPFEHGYPSDRGH